MQKAVARIVDVVRDTTVGPAVDADFNDENWGAGAVVNGVRIHNPPTPGAWVLVEYDLKPGQGLAAASTSAAAGRNAPNIPARTRSCRAADGVAIACAGGSGADPQLREAGGKAPYRFWTRVDNCIAIPDCNMEGDIAAAPLVANVAAAAAAVTAGDCRSYKDGDWNKVPGSCTNDNYDSDIWLLSTPDDCNAAPHIDHHWESRAGAVKTGVAEAACAGAPVFEKLTEKSCTIGRYVLVDTIKIWTYGAGWTLGEVAKGVHCIDDPACRINNQYEASIRDGEGEEGRATPPPPAPRSCGIPDTPRGRDGKERPRRRWRWRWRRRRRRRRWRRRWLGRAYRLASTSKLEIQ